VTRLRAGCPECGTRTAVAVGPEYECHRCGRSWAAGLVRVPRAWGSGGEAMAAAASLPLDLPEAAVVDEGSLSAQTLALAAELPERPLVLGGCCCAHVGAVEGLAARGGRLALVWLDAHGDLNTPESSPSGNAWGMPLRMILDGGAVEPADTALVGARALDPPEVEFLRASGVHASARAALEGAGSAYVAFDLDVLDPGDVAAFMPEPGGLRLEAAVLELQELAAAAPIAGAGFTGATADPANVAVVSRLAAALGLARNPEPGGGV
jgi:arginase family enzyme